MFSIDKIYKRPFFTHLEDNVITCITTSWRHNLIIVGLVTGHIIVFNVYFPQMYNLDFFKKRELDGTPKVDIYKFLENLQEKPTYEHTNMCIGTHDSEIKNLDISNDGTVLISSAKDMSVKIWKIIKNSVSETITGSFFKEQVELKYITEIINILISLDNKYIFVMFKDVVQMIDTTSGLIVKDITIKNNNRMLGMTLSHNYIAILTYYFVYLFEFKTSNLITINHFNISEINEVKEDKLFYKEPIIFNSTYRYLAYVISIYNPFYNPDVNKKNYICVLEMDTKIMKVFKTDWVTSNMIFCDNYDNCEVLMYCNCMTINYINLKTNEQINMRDGHYILYPYYKNIWLKCGEGMNLQYGRDFDFCIYKKWNELKNFEQNSLKYIPERCARGTIIRKENTNIKTYIVNM